MRTNLPSSFSIKECSIYLAPCWSSRTNKSALLSSPSFKISFFPCCAFFSYVFSFFFTLCGMYGKKTSTLFFSFILRLQRVHGHLCRSRNNMTNVLAKLGAVLCPFIRQALVASFISHIHSSLLLDCRRTASSIFLFTQAPLVSIEKLVFPRDIRCVLARLRCN